MTMKLKYFLFASAVLLLDLHPAAAAIKPCTELQGEIEAKLAAKGVKSHRLTVVEKEEDAQGKTVGSCENSSKKIMYIKQELAPAEPRKQGSAVEDIGNMVIPVCKDQKADPAAAQNNDPVFSCEGSSARAKRKEKTVQSGNQEFDQDKAAEEALAEVTAQGIKPCPELKAEIEAKLQAHKVRAYTLNIVGKHDKATGKIVGTCENSSKKIMYIRK